MATPPVWAAASTPRPEPRPLRFAPLPGENHELAMGEYSPMLQELARILHRRVEFVFTGAFDELFDRFRAGEVDLAALGPLPYITLRERYAAAAPLALFRDAAGKTADACAIIAFGAAPLPLDGLHSHRFALTQTYYTCGYMAAQNLLRAHGSGLEHNRFHYFISQESVVLAVVRGEFDGGCVRTTTARQFSHLGIRIIDETPPLPGLALVANTETLPEKDRQIIRDFLTDSDLRRTNKAGFAAWGETVRYGAVAVSDADYDATRRYRGAMAIPAKGTD
ncbi:MAG: PhnD/SsuA/transferrin family substrate-binding protein [Desulfobulbaceae bacterium]|nr:PhnD/SsuA/transferrin family substrate-binding protein [Desulfobulbaceae bacterium]